MESYDLKLIASSFFMTTKREKWEQFVAISKTNQKQKIIPKTKKLIY